MAALPKFYKIQSPEASANLMQDLLVKTLNPVFDNPLLSGQVLKSVPLVVGSNSVNHKLGRNLLGWFITRQRATASFFDTQDTNTTPTMTLDLTSSAIVVVDIYVY